MIFTYEKTAQAITIPEEINLKSQNILERQHLEKWVENYPAIIGEDLLIITTEYDKFDKTNERLDLLALDESGNLVVIELKRDDSGKNVDLQALKYAAYCSTLTLQDVIQLHYTYLKKKNKKINEEDVESRIKKFITDSDFEELSDKPRIIIVSKEFRPEVTASVLWLRKFGLDITCVKLTPYELTKDSVAFESNILIPLPEAEDYIIRSEKKDNIKHNKTLTQEENFKFYNQLIQGLEQILPGNYPESSTRSYYGIPTGIKGVHFEWAFHGRPRNSFGVELHFENSSREYNVQTCNKMKNFIKIIENKTNEKVICMPDWGKKWARIYIEKKEGQMTDELKNWAIENMKIFIETFQPELDKIN